MVPTSVKYENSDEIKTSEFINGNYDMIINYDMMDVLIDSGWFKIIDDYVKNKNNKNNKNNIENKNIENIIQNNNNENNNKNNNNYNNIYSNWDQLDWNDENIKKLIDGLFNFNIHNYTNTGDNCDNEISLMPLFKSLNCIENELLREEAYSKSYLLCTNKAILI